VKLWRMQQRIWAKILRANKKPDTAGSIAAGLTRREVSWPWERPWNFYAGIERIKYDETLKQMPASRATNDLILDLGSPTMGPGPRVWIGNEHRDAWLYWRLR